MKNKSTFVRLLSLSLALLLIVPSLGIAETADDPELAQGASLRIMSYNILHPDWSRIPVTGRVDTVAGILLYYMPDVAAIQ